MHKWENKNKKAKVTDNMMGVSLASLLLLLFWISKLYSRINNNQQYMGIISDKYKVT